MHNTANRFAVTVVDLGGQHLVSGDGDVDVDTVAVLRARLDEAFDRAGGRVVLDCSQGGFVDSTGMAVVKGTAERLRDSGRNLVLPSPSGATRLSFDAIGLARVATIED